MGWLDDIADTPWQKVWEDIQKTTQEWVAAMPKLMPEQKLTAPIPENQLGPDNPNDVQPQPTPTPVPQFVYDYMPYIADQEAVNAKFPQGIPQPSPEQSQLIRQYMPQDATPAAIAIATESGWNPKAENRNTDQSLDRGLGQINSNTFADYMRRMPNTLQGMGITAYQDMFDPAKNLQMMDLIRKYQGWDAWYGPKNYGFDLNK